MAQDLYKYFQVEARELSEQMGKAVLELEKQPAAPQLVAQLLRLAHTLKGAARVVKQRDIANHAHGIESALAPYRDESTPVSRAQIDLLLREVDQISTCTRTMTASEASTRTAARSVTQDAPAAILRADVEEVDALLEGLSEAGVQVDALRQCLGDMARVRRLSHQLSELWAREPKTAGAPLALKQRATVSELRSLCDTIERGLTGSVEQIERELRQAREGAERLRLLPARLMFHVLERTARDAARELGKRVVFSAQGGEVRLEADLLNQVQHALVQAVRNALAHGIESESERKAAHKSTEGSVCIEVERRGERVAFRCRDDGRGVALEAVRRAAEQKGVVAANAPQLSPQATLDLLLKAGISTASEITEIAGRGVGLDLVRDVATRLGGEVRLASEPGRGMTLELLVPVSLASLDALIVEAAGQRAAIPLESVRRTVRVAPHDLSHSASGTALVYEDNVIPFTTLARALHLPELEAHTRSWSAVVVAGHGALAALGVDRLRGTENVVVRPLPALAPAEHVVAGASLDASGHPQLVLDADGLVALARSELPRPKASSAQRTAVLVIDDSLTTRMLEQSILESAGYEVDLACSAEEALSRARQRRYGLFLVDVEMPGMDGYGFIETIRADPGLCDLPAILVTSRASAEDRERGSEVGANGFIVKSEFEQTELLDRIRSLVGGGS